MRFYLIFYARVIYHSSKLETFKQCQNFIEQPIFKLHDEYRALSYIAENRDSSVIYYDCTNYFFDIDIEDDLRKYGISKEHRSNPNKDLSSYAKKANKTFNNMKNYIVNAFDYEYSNDIVEGYQQSY